MARRYIHYEAAFEDYLRSQALPYVAVDENRRAIFSGSRVKSFDFLVYRNVGPHWLVDVKGRKFPYEKGTQRRYWENWVSYDDLHDLEEWQKAFGDGFQAMLVFAYWFTENSPAATLIPSHMFRGEYYAFLFMSVFDYQAKCVGRSPKWKTFTVPARVFRSCARTF